MSLPYFPMYPSDYEAKTSHLTIAEDGAYFRLLRLCWMTAGCSLPDDEAWIMRRARAFSDDERQAIKAILDEFFTLKNGRWINERLTTEYKEAASKHLKRKKAGRKGGSVKSLKSNDNEPSNAKAMLKQCSSNQNQNQNQNQSILDDTKVSLANQFKDDCEIAVSKWNKAADEHGWPKVQRLTAARSKQLAGRIKEAGGLDGWQAALQKAGESDFLCGRNGAWSGFGFDWMVKAGNFTKLMEGNYENRSGNITAINGAGQRGGNAGQGSYERERLRGIAAGIQNPKGY
jgi:uncharacterized protein YdaU (DUF1376 family)